MFPPFLETVIACTLALPVPSMIPTSSPNEGLLGSVIVKLALLVLTIYFVFAAALVLPVASTYVYPLDALPPPPPPKLNVMTSIAAPLTGGVSNAPSLLGPGVSNTAANGDGGVDISPIADLYKTEVRELGRYLGVPQDIINATPTDGLWDDDRNDEEQIGATYEELEWVMEYGINKQVYTKKEFNILEIYQNFNNKNNHKMIQIPIFDLKENEII